MISYKILVNKPTLQFALRTFACMIHGVGIGGIWPDQIKMWIFHGLANCVEMKVLSVQTCVL